MFVFSTEQEKTPERYQKGRPEPKPVSSARRIFIFVVLKEASFYREIKCKYGNPIQSPFL